MFFAVSNLKLLILGLRCPCKHVPAISSSPPDKAKFSTLGTARASLSPTLMAQSRFEICRNLVVMLTLFQLTFCNGAVIVVTRDGCAFRFLKDTHVPLRELSYNSDQYHVEISRQEVRGKLFSGKIFRQQRNHSKFDSFPHG